MAVEDRAEGFGEVGERVHAGHFAGGEQRGEHCPVLGANFVAGEERIFPCQGNHPVILPMSDRRSKSTIAGTPCMGTASAASAASSVKPEELSTSRRRRGWSSWPQRGFWIRPSAPGWGSVRRAWRYRHWLSCISC